MAAADFMEELALADGGEPMTFSQREKVPMQHPRGARVLHRRLRGEKAEGLRSFSRRL